MSKATQAPAGERLSSGVPGLDTVLAGGFFRSGVYIVQGMPGSGKTILGNQLCYSHVAAGGKAVYVTLLAESHSRMLQHLRPFSFFDESFLPERLSYISAFHDLETEGLKGLMGTLRREMRARNATVLVLDGVVAATEAAESDKELKKFVHEIQTSAVFHECTVFLLTSGGVQRMSAEHTMVDGLIEMEERLYGARTERSIRVRKFRGAAPVNGRHVFRICDDGIEVFPRLEALPRATAPGGARPPSLSSGCTSLDTLTRAGGYPSASSTVVVGTSGSGKTTLALHFVQGATPAEPALFLGTYEPAESLHEKAATYGWDFAAMQASGALQMLWFAPGEVMLDVVGHRLLQQVQRTGARRVVIDGLSALAQAAVEPERLGHYFSCLINDLRAIGATVLLTLEVRDVAGDSATLPFGISAFVDNLFLLRFVQDDISMRRFFTIAKMRDANFEPGLRELVLGAEGMQIAGLGGAGGAVMPSVDRLTGERRPSTSAGSAEK